MSQNNKSAENGTFRKRKSFTMASNAAIRDRKLSLKAKGLYTFIMSYATMPGLTLTKRFLAIRCQEKDRAFNSAWDELKTHGFLKVYFTPSGENNRWCVEYELLDVANPADGVHTYYYNLAGEVTATNLTRKAQRDNAEPAPEQQADSHTPQNVGDAPRTLHYRTNGNRTYGERTNGNGGNNIILPCNTKNNTQDNHSFIQQENEGMSEEEIQDKVMEELTIQQAIPYQYASDPKMMECAIHYLTEWEFRCKHPFLTTRGFVDDRRMNAFKFCIECLIEMACARQQANYRGALISYANVIDAINRNSDHCTEGGHRNHRHPQIHQVFDLEQLFHLQSEAGRRLSFVRRPQTVSPVPCKLPVQLTTGAVPPFRHVVSCGPYKACVQGCRGLPAAITFDRHCQK